MIKIPEFNAIGEQHSVSKPVETVGENDLSFRSRCNTIEIDRCAHFVPGAKADLPFVRLGKRVGLPEGHDTILICGGQ